MTQFRIRSATSQLLTLALCLLAAAWVHPPQALANQQAQVVKIERLTHNVKRIRFKAANDDFTFQAGQFILLKLPDAYLRAFNKSHGTEHTSVSRPYSFASAPSEAPYFDLIVKHYPAPPGKDVPPGLASTFIHQHLRPSNTVTFSDPVGSLYMPNDSTDPIILVAGGVGASPFIGLLKHWFDQGLDRQREIHFFFGVRSKHDFFLLGDLADWSRRRKNFKYILALSHPDPADEWKGESGYINTVLDRHFPSPLRADVYLAGAPIMIRETVKVLHTKQVPDTRIHHDPIKVQ
ncbi:MAG: FAD-binding oxidoreductase [Bryobacterales bacterium]|nr:FAD-binding oxidoreductase [Bryobacterales bacterium]MDE0294011.1 FAD-binding oxidoreductase [Bryobacterales bacterium]